MAQGSPALTALGDRLAETAFPRGIRCAIRRRLRAGRHLRPADGPAGDIKLGDGLDRVGKQLGKTNSLIGTALRLLDGRRRQPGNAENVAGHADARARCRQLADDQQGQSRRLAVFLRGFPGGLRQRLAEADRLVLHPAGSGRRDGATSWMTCFESRFGRMPGLASPDVTLADPAVGTGTFLLGALRRIADRSRGGRRCRARFRKRSTPRSVACRVRTPAWPVRRRAIAHPCRACRPDRHSRRRPRPDVCDRHAG